MIAVDVLRGDSRDFTWDAGLVSSYGDLWGGACGSRRYVHIQLHTRWVVAERGGARRERHGRIDLEASERACKGTTRSSGCPRFETKVSSLDSCRATVGSSSGSGTVAVSVFDISLKPVAFRAFTA